MANGISLDYVLVAIVIDTHVHILAVLQPGACMNTTNGCK